MLILVVAYFLTVTAINTVQANPTGYKESDFTKDELNLSGLNDEQKKLTLKILNNHNCNCGCAKDTWAECIKTDKNCPYSRPMGDRVAEMVKVGESEEFIRGFFDGWKEGTQKKGRKDEDPNKVYPVIPMNAPSKGPTDAPVTMIMYLDYQCPFCKQVNATLKALLNEYPDKIRLFVMNNPLSFHKNAMPAALAARAAERQGKFWEMHDSIFESSAPLDDSNLLKIAEKAGLNIEKFNADRNDEQLKAEILKEQEQAVKNGATGTPATFVNGKKYGGAKPLPEFKNAVDAALKEANVTAIPGSK